jgi:ornithine decarboxylase
VLFRDIYKILIIAQEQGQHTPMRRQGEAIVRKLIDTHKIKVDIVRNTHDALTEVERDASVGTVLIEWGDKGEVIDTRAVIARMRDIGLEAPVWVVVFNRSDIPTIRDLLREEITGFILTDEDTPDFIARYVNRHFDDYVNSLKTPFFGALADYNDRSNEAWDCPGHNGGMYFRKSPIGRAFFEYLGENVFRMDLCNADVELGDLLIHAGPARRAEEEAAKILGADRTYFVLNGTSTSNKVVLSALVKEGDLVLYDRNNHKSNNHGALQIAGGIPVYLETDRNSQGLIGPVDYHAWDEKNIREKIRNHPLVKDPEAWKKPRPFRVLIMQTVTYDGTIYNVRDVLDRVGRLCEYILFDEAWGSYLPFHPLFHNNCAMGLKVTADDPGIISTQSTHKQLSGFSQASQICVKDKHIEGQQRHCGHQRFNEFYMLHASTSPFYPLWASLDVGAQMMKGRNGFHLWNEAIGTAIEMRKTLRKLAREFASEAKKEEEKWFFDPFVPDVVSLKGSPHHPDTRNTPWEDIPADVLLKEKQCWEMKKGAAWHGYAHIEDGYAMVDPCKLELVTPGFDRKSGAYLDWGIPASVLAQFLRERGIVPEKNDLNTILFLVTPGIETSKAGTLISALVAFKRLFDRNAPLAEVLPVFYRTYSKHYAGTGVRDLCIAMHRFYRENDVSGLQKRQFRAEHFPEIAMSPRAAIQKLAANEVDYLPLDRLEGRIATTLNLVYPPGIGVIVPGERYTKRCQPMLDYFRMFEESYARFPGFANEIQGVYPEEVEGRTRLYTYVVKSG